MVIILKDKFKEGLSKQGKYLKSMRFRLMLSIFVVTLVPVWIFSQVILNIVDDNMVSQQLEKLRSQTTALRNHIINAGAIDNSNTSIQVELDTLSSMYNSRIQIIDRRFRIINDTYLVDRGKFNISTGVLECFKGNNTFEYNQQTGIVEGNMAIVSTNSTSIDGVINITFSTDEIDVVIARIRDRVFLLVMLILVILVGLSLLISAMLVRPFRKIEESIEQITAGNYKEQMQINGYYETEKITDAFNQMLTRFNEIDESRTEFVSNVSHELKTPITSVKVLAESMVGQTGIPEEMYQEFLGDIVNEVDRENAIITDLLTLVRLDKQADQLKLEQVNINDSISLVMKRLRPIAEKKNVELVFESFRPVIAQVDEVKMGIVINNLMENAVKYNVPDGWVHVYLNSDHKYFYLKVSDCGVGIPDDAQEKIFDRFYRVDESRTRDDENAVGGTGLGLAITKSIILMHRGAIKVYSKLGEGTTFTMRIPLSYITVEDDFGRKARRKEP